MAILHGDEPRPPYLTKNVTGFSDLKARTHRVQEDKNKNFLGMALTFKKIHPDKIDICYVS